jgi:hypothetical protein
MLDVQQPDANPSAGGALRWPWAPPVRPRLVMSLRYDRLVNYNPLAGHLLFAAIRMLGPQ